METIRIKTFTYFVGIDISRNELDFVVMLGKEYLFHREIKNQIPDIKELIADFKKLPRFSVAKAVFCMEHTGIYSNHLLSALKKIKANIVLENAVHIRNSLGKLRGKYDKIDAIRIAQYAYKNRENLRIWVPRRLIIDQLAHLSTLRNRLISIKGMLVNPLKEENGFVHKNILSPGIKLCEASVDALKADLVAVDTFIATLIESDDNLKRLLKIITSVPCVGTVTALQIIITTNEFRDFRDPKKFGCYAGVVPFKKESGLIVGKARVSHMANKNVKTLLHLCAITAIRHDPELKSYYERKTKIDGKPKMAVVNALRNKIVLRIFACINQDRCYEKEYKWIRNDTPTKRTTEIINE